MAAASSIVAGLALGASVVNAFKGSKGAPPPAPPVLPPPPARDSLGEERAVTRARQRKLTSSRASSIYTSPKGVTAPADTARPSLLGD